MTKLTTASPCIHVWGEVVFCLIGTFVLVIRNRVIVYNVCMKSLITYKRNNNVVYSCKYHVVWCPKYRRKVLVNGIDTRLKSILYEVANETNSEIIELEIMPDHVHVLVECDPQFGINKLVRMMKGRSSVIYVKNIHH